MHDSSWQWKSSSDAGVGLSLYLSTKAAIPCFAKRFCYFPSFITHRKPHKASPGATITVAPFALPGNGKNGVRVAVVMLRAIGSPHWRNQDSEAGWLSTPPVPRGIAFGSAGVLNGRLFRLGLCKFSIESKKPK